MSHSEKCPICNGTGAVSEAPDGVSTCPSKIVCHGCNGNGWITVQDNPPPYIPAYTPPHGPYYEPPSYFPPYGPGPVIQYFRVRC